MDVKKNKPFFVCFFAKTSEHTINEIDGFFPIFMRIEKVSYNSSNFTKKLQQNYVKIFFAESVFSVN